MGRPDYSACYSVEAVTGAFLDTEQNKAVHQGPPLYIHGSIRWAGYKQEGRKLDCGFRVNLMTF